ncbi:zinicin-like metallopeptidase [Streptomyces sp. Ag109_O5-1]|uniref:zinc-dependent metalloprotease n=1 Tax=Streptomyces sp. Ag109_O5-1 TaxID=1938851 RepID=UPI000F515058|nr:zinc-dependent metalloprotease [Streptomyces sp. Ag109_O5-1]RPE39081.1 zinicin-like metallopeptidase [Streptomyces sp. Ag109_O5-1]
MTRFTVLDDTRRHPELTELLLSILHTVAPVVQETTRLPLPAKVRYRLLTPKKWRNANRLNQQRILARDIADQKLTPQQIRALRGILKMTSFVPVLVWPLVFAQTMEAADGQVETIIAPRALHHSGFLTNQPCLTVMTAHELVHHAQFEARRGLVWETYAPDRRGMDRRGRGASTVLEGHATWAEQQTTTRLFGAPVNHRELAKRSWRYRLHAGFPGVRCLGPRLDSYEQGARLITHAVDTHGVDVVNRVWKDIFLLPTADEVAALDTWAQRLAVPSEQRSLVAKPIEQS